MTTLEGTSMHRMQSSTVVADHVGAAGSFRGATAHPKPQQRALTLKQIA